MSNRFLVELAEKMIKEKHFSKLWNFYFDNVHKIQAEISDSISRGTVSFPDLTLTVQLSCKNCFGITEQPSLLLFKVNKDFYHGILSWEQLGRSGTMIFFKNHKKGALAIPHLLNNTDTEFLRFSLGEIIHIPDGNELH